MDVCCDVTGNSEFVGDRIPRNPPAALDASHRGIINGFGVPQRLVRGGGDGQLAIRQMNTTDATEQPAADGAVGVVVQRIMGLPLKAYRAKLPL